MYVQIHQKKKLLVLWRPTLQQCPLLCCFAGAALDLRVEKTPEWRRWNPHQDILMGSSVNGGFELEMEVRFLGKIIYEGFVYCQVWFLEGLHVSIQAKRTMFAENSLASLQIKTNVFIEYILSLSFEIHHFCHPLETSRNHIQCVHV